MLSANDIAELEKKYSKYIFKKRVKLFFILILILSVILFTLYYLLYGTNNQKNILDTNKTEKSIIKKIKPIDSNLTKIEKTTTIKKENNVTKSEKNISNMTEKIIKLDVNISNDNNIEKKLVFHIKPQNKIVSNTKTTETLRLNRYFLNKKSKAIKQKNINAVKNINKNDTMLKEKDIKPKIHIEMRDIDSIQYLKEKFQRTHDLVFALMLCENYYSQKNYRKSLKWSIIANDIDSKNEKSWMWFAKSKYRLHKKEDAIKALRAFLELNESKNIKLLLKDILNGELND